MTSNRILYYDVARGIAMILVVLSHCVGNSILGLNKFILCFHMPLFFFISGCFAKGSLSLRGGQFRGYVFHKIKYLLIPQLTLCFLRIVQEILSSLYAGRGISNVQWINWDWFLPVLLMCACLYTFVTSIVRSDSIRIKTLMLVISVLLVIGGQWLNRHEFYYYAIINSRHFAVFPMAFSFYLLGSISKNIISKIVLKSSVCNGLIILLTIPLIYLIAGHNELVLMYKNVYGNILLFLVSCLLGIYFIVSISKRLEVSPFLLFIGNHSIEIYVWNFLIVQISYTISKVISSLFGLNMLGSVGLVAFVIAMIILYNIVIISDKYCPFIYGKSV